MAEGSGWDRAELSMRLGRQRKAKLAEIARGMAAGATPTDAIDRAIDLALAAESTKRVDVEGVEDSIEALASAQRADIERLSKEVRRLADGVDSLRALIASIATQDEF